MLTSARPHYRFSGHESFACRYAWLPKAYRALRNDPLIFSDEPRAMVELGLGKNMVRSLRFGSSLAEGLESAAAEARADDVRLLMATQQFAKRPAYRHLEQRLQRDIKAFFGDYKSAQAAGLRLLLEAADPQKILAACRGAATQGLGLLGPIQN